MITVLIRVFVLIQVVLVAAASSVWAQTPDQPSGQVAQRNGESIHLPVSVEKIQKAISRPAAIEPRSDRVVFRVEVFAKKPTVEDILGPDYLKGPVSYGGMTHSEFLNMVTPIEFKGYSMFLNKEAMLLAAASFATQWALMKAIDKLKDARTERAKEAARREVLEAMNELEAARKKAGLPPSRQP
jgi:hypothetical protein